MTRLAELYSLQVSMIRLNQPINPSHFRAENVPRHRKTVASLMIGNNLGAEPIRCYKFG